MKESRSASTSPGSERARSSPSAVGDPRPSRKRVTPGRAMLLPVGFTVALLALGLAPGLRGSPSLFAGFVGAAVVLLAWAAVLFWKARSSGRSLTLEIGIYKHHWVQALTQLSILLYWGWHVRFVYAYFPLILAQLLFAYGVESLLQWSRGDNYRFGFGPWPIIGSINLFLWFKPEWFYWQFVMILLGYLGKELIRWRKNGRSAHIFNPSSFPLAVFSLGLILTGTTDVTLGPEIAQTQFNPPRIYLFIFLVSLPVQLLFGVARVTMAAVATVFLISYGYFAATGTYLFLDSFISLPVFLGMHLLITDPSTSPRNETGQLVFGVVYGLGIVGIYWLLVSLGAPPFYDKLLPVPLMNLTVRAIDRFVASDPLARFDLSKLGTSLSRLQRNLVYTSVWIVIFTGLSAFGGLGDDHEGQYLPFWRDACVEGSDRACTYAVFMLSNYCEKGSGWACNEYGVQLTLAGRTGEADGAFDRGCGLGFPPACDNARGPTPTGLADLARSAPRLEDLPVILRGSKGPVEERDPERLHEMACEQGWESVCERAPAAAGGLDD